MFSWEIGSWVDDGLAIVGANQHGSSQDNGLGVRVIAANEHGAAGKGDIIALMHGGIGSAPTTAADGVAKRDGADAFPIYIDRASVRIHAHVQRIIHRRIAGWIVA